MFEKLLPKEHSFFEHFEKLASLGITCAEHFLLMCKEEGEKKKTAAIIHDLEHQADQVVHDSMEILHQSFITPFDREEILRLLSYLDDIIDSIDAAANSIVAYKITTILPQAVAFSEILLKATKNVLEAVVLLRTLKKGDEIRSKCLEINKLEQEADVVLRNAVVNLFEQEQDVKTLIKWKEVFENLEQAVDRCDDAANAIISVLLEYS